MSPRLRNPEIRWVVLALACTLMASNFYAYDLPASLNTPMQAWLGLSDGDFAYAVNLFYSVYSFPNIVLPFFGGYLIDKFGVRWLMMILSFVQFMGQVVFSLGNDRKSVAVMLLGRLLFGVGGESLAVAQNSVTARYFRGKELALALGLNLAIARLGSVANDLVSPKLAVRFSVSLAVWVGTATCFVALICSIVLGWLDARLTRESEMDAARGAGAGAGAAAPPPNPAHYAQLSDDADKDSDRASELPVEMEEAEGAEPMPSASTSRLSRSTSVRVNLVDESRVHTRHRDHSHDMAEHHGSSDPSSAALLSPPGTELPGSTPRSPALAASRTSFTTIRLPLPSSPIPSGAVHHINRIPNISDFPVSYHLLLIVIVFQYATVVPFGTIHSALLQLKWYPSDPELAGEVMGVPDTISAVMVPFVGTFVSSRLRPSSSCHGFSRCASRGFSHYASLFH